MPAPPDLTPNFSSILDDGQYQRDGTIVKSKKYVFYLGKFGPFTERVPLDNFDPTEITRRIQTLKTHLLQLHQ